MNVDPCRAVGHVPTLDDGSGHTICARCGTDLSPVTKPLLGSLSSGEVRRPSDTAEIDRDTLDRALKASAIPDDEPTQPQLEELHPFCIGCRGQRYVATRTVGADGREGVRGTRCRVCNGSGTQAAVKPPDDEPPQAA